MSRKNKYKNAIEVITLLEGYALHKGLYMSLFEVNCLELNNEKDRKILLEEINKIKKVCENAIEELTT